MNPARSLRVSRLALSGHGLLAGVTAMLIMPAASADIQFQGSVRRNRHVRIHRELGLLLG